MTDATPQPDPAVTSLTAKAGDKVDNYTIMEQVGAGGTAIVFRGHDHVLNRSVAIKQLVVPPGEAGDDVRQRAMAEAQLHKRAAASDPKLLVQYIDTINDPRGLFLISEYVDGPSLEWILQQETGPMEQRQALGIIAATAKALQALHNGGLVHRDLKPSNILMPREGGLKLADFGLAAIIADQQSMDLGSVRYMAPEVLQGQPASPQSDLYSLGMIAYEMLAGRDLFAEAFRTILRDQRNQSMRWVKWHTNARAKVTPLDQLVESVPESLSQLVARMMEKEPTRRVGSANELFDAIRMHFAQGGQQPMPSPHAAMAPPKIDDVSQTAQVPQRSKLPIILAATLVVWIAAIGVFFYIRGEQQAQEENKRTNALITAIESADSLISDQDYVAARDAFAVITIDHATEFDPNQRKYRDDLVEAGQLKAESLLAAQNDDYIAALDKAREYRKRLAKWNDPPSTPRTTLSESNAEKLIEEYKTRAAFQQLANKIEGYLDEGELNKAINEVRLARDNSTANTAPDDIARLNELEKRYKLLLNNELILNLLAEARALRDAGELGDAIDKLEAEVDAGGESVDPRVVSLLEEMNKAVRIVQIQKDIDSAEDDEELLAALVEMRREQPTQALEAQIRDLRVAMMIEEAEEALLDNRPEKAQQILNDIRELDPGNAQVARMLESIEDARKMVMAVKAGDQAMANNNYTEAINHWREALKFGTDTDGTLNTKITQATGLMHLQTSDKALAKGDVAAAQTQLDEARTALGDSDAVLDMQERIDELSEYNKLIEEGDALFAKGSFGRAKVKYLNAKKIFDSQAINQKVRDCDFYIWLDQCKQAIITRDWEAADSALKRAEEIKVNDETKELREKIRTRTQ